MSGQVLIGGFYSLPYDLLNDFEPIALLFKAAPISVGRKTLPAKDLRELIVWLKSNPNKASMAVSFAGARVLAPYVQQPERNLRLCPIVVALPPQCRTLWPDRLTF